MCQCITGCEYKISVERLCQVLSHWGVISSEIREEVFKDPFDQEGSNQTGIYTLRMFIHRDIPEWLPLEGLRVRIQYPRMKKLCNGCYENHLRKDCNNDKVTWADYVRSFKHSNPEFPDLFYGKWSDLSKSKQGTCQTERDFNIPTCKAEWEEIYCICVKMLWSGLKGLMMGVCKVRMSLPWDV